MTDNLADCNKMIFIVGRYSHLVTAEGWSDRDGTALRCKLFELIVDVKVYVNLVNKVEWTGTGEVRAIDSGLFHWPSADESSE